MLVHDDEAAAEGPLPAWLEPDDPENIPPAALQPLYRELPQVVTHALEDARKMIRDGFKQGVLAAHAALAGQDKVSFKDWCKAVQINYNTAESVVRRAEADKRRADARSQPAPPDPPDPGDSEDDDSDEKDDSEEEADDDDDDSDDEEQEGEDKHEEKEKEKLNPKPKDKPQPKPKKPRLVFDNFDTAEQQGQALAYLARVMESQKLPTREAALLHVLAVYDQIWSIVAEDSAVWAFVAEDGEEEEVA